MKVTLEMTLLSDTCFSSGLAGRLGDTDLEIEHDPETGLPVLRGRTLKGLLMEELALILKALEPSGPGAWHLEAQLLLGHSGAVTGGRLFLEDGQLPPSLVAWVKGEIDQRTGNNRHPFRSQEVLRALTVMRCQTRIESSTGAAEPTSLRSTRLLRAGLELHCPLQVQGVLSSRQRALLAASTLALRRVGVHRNRGWGRVSARLVDEGGQEVTEEWLESLVQSVRGSEEGSTHAAVPSFDASEQASTSTAAALLASEQVGGGSNALESAGLEVQWQVAFSIRLTAPLMQSDLSGDPNTVGTLRYVPGTAMLGAMAGRFLQSMKEAPSGLSSDLAGGDTLEARAFQALFLSGALRWLNLYPEPSPGHRLLPTPVSLRTFKDESQGRECFDAASPDFETYLEQAEVDAAELRPLKAPFIQLDLSSDEHVCRPFFPAISLRMHHKRDRDQGRPTENDLFSYESLDAGQRLAGQVLCHNEAQAKAVKALLEGTFLAQSGIRLGRSRTATYGGGAILEDAVTVRPFPTGFCEAPVLTPGQWEPDEQGCLSITVTLLSDFLGLNAAGLPDPAGLVPDLREALELPEATPWRATWSVKPVPGYVAVWRMPRPTWPAVKAGSVVVFSVPEEQVDVDALTGRIDRLHREGLGERRVEGFGRCAVGWHGFAGEAMMLEKPSRVSTSRTHASSASRESAHPLLLDLQQRLVMDRARETLTLRAYHDAELTHPLPAPALLARMRALVRQTNGLNELLSFFDNASMKRASVSLRRVRRDHETLEEWLRRLVNDTQLLTTTGAIEVFRRSGLQEGVLTGEQLEALRRHFLDHYFTWLRRRAQKQVSVSPRRAS